MKTYNIEIRIADTVVYPNYEAAKKGTEEWIEELAKDHLFAVMEVKVEEAE